MAIKKKTWIWIGGLGAVGLLWYMVSKRSAAPVPAPGIAPPAAALPAASGNQMTPDILAVMSREPADIQAKLQDLAASLSSVDFQTLDSIAHSWNNGIPLTPLQTQWWMANGVF